MSTITASNSLNMIKGEITLCRSYISFYYDKYGMAFNWPLEIFILVRDTLAATANNIKNYITYIGCNQVLEDAHSSICDAFCKFDITEWVALRHHSN